jgi:plastin-1
VRAVLVATKCICSVHHFFCRTGLSKQMKQLSFVHGLSDDAIVSREERSFKLWINSLGILSYINNVFEDLRNGYTILPVLHLNQLKKGQVDFVSNSLPS